MKLNFIILYSSDLSLAAGQLFQITPLSLRQGKKEGAWNRDCVLQPEETNRVGNNCQMLPLLGGLKDMVIHFFQYSLNLICCR